MKVQTIGLTTIAGNETLRNAPETEKDFTHFCIQIGMIVVQLSKRKLECEGFRSITVVTQTSKIEPEIHPNPEHKIIFINAVIDWNRVNAVEQTERKKLAFETMRSSVLKIVPKYCSQSELIEKCFNKIQENLELIKPLREMNFD